MLILIGLPILILVGTFILMCILYATNRVEGDFMVLIIFFSFMFSFLVFVVLLIFNEVSLSKVDPVVVEKLEIKYNPKTNVSPSVYAIFFNEKLIVFYAKEGSYNVNVRELDYDIVANGEVAEYIKWRKHKDGNLWQQGNTEEWETVTIPSNIIKEWNNLWLNKE